MRRGPPRTTIAVVAPGVYGVCHGARACCKGRVQRFRPRGRRQRGSSFSATCRHPPCSIRDAAVSVFGVGVWHGWTGSALKAAAPRVVPRTPHTLVTPSKRRRHRSCFGFRVAHWFSLFSVVVRDVLFRPHRLSVGPPPCHAVVLFCVLLLFLFLIWSRGHTRCGARWVADVALVVCGPSLLRGCHSHCWRAPPWFHACCGGICWPVCGYDGYPRPRPRPPPCCWPPKLPPPCCCCCCW